MTPQTEELLKKALDLPAVERASLVDRLLVSLDNPDEAVDEVWRQEIGRRLAAYRAGKAETLSTEEVRADYRSQ
jgi:putative addiction module component (TIGR02574 family)